MIYQIGEILSAGDMILVIRFGRRFRTLCLYLHKLRLRPQLQLLRNTRLDLVFRVVYWGYKGLSFPGGTDQTKDKQKGREKSVTVTFRYAAAVFVIDGGSGV